MVVSCCCPRAAAASHSIVPAASTATVLVGLAARVTPDGLAYSCVRLVCLQDAWAHRESLAGQGTPQALSGCPARLT